MNCTLQQIQFPVYCSFVCSFPVLLQALCSLVLDNNPSQFIFLALSMYCLLANFL